MLDAFSMANLVSQFNRDVRKMIENNDGNDIIQVLYVIYINDETLHDKHDFFIKIGTTTLNRLHERLKEHSMTFAKINPIGIYIIKHSCIEKKFHTFMKTYHRELYIEMDTCYGKLSEIYLPDLNILTILEQQIQ